MSYKIIFDTETTGLRCYENQVAQLSYMMINDKYEVQNAKNFYFSVKYVEPGASKINGLDDEILEKLSEGKEFRYFAEEIYKDFLNAKTLIAHNLSFDLGFIEEEFNRLDYDIDKLKKDKLYCCTMDVYTHYLQIEHEYYGLKYPRLDEVMSRLSIDDEYIENLTKTIFKVDSNKYHDSRFDIVATFIAYKSLDCINEIMTCKNVFKYLNRATNYLEYINNSYKKDFSAIDEGILNEVYGKLMLDDYRKSFKRDIDDVIKQLENVKKEIEMEERRLKINRESKKF